MTRRASFTCGSIRSKPYRGTVCGTFHFTEVPGTVEALPFPLNASQPSPFGAMAVYAAQAARHLRTLSGGGKVISPSTSGDIPIPQPISLTASPRHGPIKCSSSGENGASSLIPKSLSSERFVFGASPVVDTASCRSIKPGEQPPRRYTPQGGIGIQQHPAPVEEPKKKLGLFGGVLVPTCENMWGVIIFLRFYVIVGNAGLGMSLLIVTLSFSVGVLTTPPPPPPFPPSSPAPWPPSNPSF